MIASFCEGRVRFRLALVEDPACAALMRSALLGVEGVRNVTINSRTRGLLLEYDPASFPRSRLMRAMPILGRLESLEALPPAERVEALKDLLGAWRGLWASA